MKIIISALLILNIGALLYINYLKSNVENTSNYLIESERNTIAYKEKINFLHNNLFFTLINSGLRVDDKVSKQEYKIIGRFNELNCTQCVDSALMILKKYGEAIGSENINLWVSYSNERAYKTFLHNNQIEWKVKKITNLKLPAENVKSPYFFILDKENGIHNVFLPDKEFVNYTNEYLSLITKKYFTKQHNKQLFSLEKER